MLLLGKPVENAPPQAALRRPPFRQHDHGERFARLAVALTLAGLAPHAGAAGEEPAYPTSMERFEPERPRRSDVILGAPHAGYDLHTEAIARAAGERLGCAVAVARNFRKKRVRRYVNVNRPSEAEVARDGSVGSERETEGAREVFERWCETVGAARERLPLYVEIHGFARSVERDGESVPLEVVELATVGVDRETARRLRDAWGGLAAELDLPPLYIDVLDERYEFHGERERFRLRATEARTTGILQDRYVERALHVELPARLRGDPERRRAAAQAIAALVELLAPVPAGG